MLSYEKQLSKRQQLGNLRHLQIVPPLIDFASNDYLGLARSPRLAQAIEVECTKYRGHLNGWGSTGSRLLTGNSAYAYDLEECIAQFHGYAAGLLFSCGYMANVGLLSAIASAEDTIIFDINVHASTHDGIHLSRAKAFPFRHNDLSHLEYRLQHCMCKGDRFVCIESIYSTDGSTAPLSEICHLTNKYKAHLIVDEAHAIGLYGPEGRGLVAEYGLTAAVFAQVVTFGKALGTYGAAVLGSNSLKQALINFATSYVFTTALPFQMLAAIKCSYALFPGMNNARQQLMLLIKTFCQSFPFGSKTHIQSIPVIGNAPAKKAAHDLRNQGYDVRALLSPTVKRGGERLRICLHAFNTENEVLALTQTLTHMRLSHV